MPQGIHRQVYFRAASAFGRVETRARTALRRRLQRAAIENRRRGLRVATFGHAQQFTQVDRHGFKHTGLEPSLALLIHRVPGWQIMRHHAPRRPCTDNPAQAIKHFPQAILTLRGLFGHEGQIGGHKGPFVSTDVAGVRFSFHTSSLASVDQST